MLRRLRMSFRLIVCLLIGLCTACEPVNRASTGPTPGIDVIELSICQAHEALRSGRISCEQLTRRYLQRIETYDPPTKADAAPSPSASRSPTPANRLNAIIAMNPNALARARQLDRQSAKTGRLRRLHCIPVILKDNVDTADMPTEAGSIALKGSVPPDDAFLVQRLRAEDAIILAKSNMGEWAFSPYQTISSTHGETRNAYALDRVPAGSSGGTASAIAANLGIIGIGTDTGNSIRGPASHLALVGIRSTLGATSRDGIVPLLGNRDVGGPLMRTVTDTAIVYSVLAGYDPADPLTQAGIGRVKPDYRRYLKRDGLQGARLGVLRALVVTETDTGMDVDTADPEVVVRFDQAIEDLREAGAVIIDPFQIPDFERLTEATGFCSRFRYDLNRYLNTLGPNAPIRSLGEVVASNQFLPQSAGAMQWAMAVDVDPGSQQPPCVDVQGDPRRKALLEAVLAAMDEQQIDAILYPSWSHPPRLLGDSESPHGNNSPVLAPHTGQPAITVPMGFTDSGLPLGLQLLARSFDEHKLLQYAYAYEQATQHRRPPPGFGPLQPEALSMTLAR
ncbi:MAG: amidase family protein [Lamprobacter sp.]|uniref:amidase family protein n=1 Tax=Lamprobacter sp. TaxID=3100796 RepID=UPI002B25884B|nr:amidase family protein [Lamprobacter sp.]MEA3642526.1 amidase family protein [Lamprobacter sp.]